MNIQHIKVIGYSAALLIVAAIVICWPQINGAFTQMMTQRAVDHIGVVQKAYVRYLTDHKFGDVNQVQLPSLEQLNEGNYLSGKDVAEVHQIFPEIRYLGFSGGDDTTPILELKNWLGHWFISQAGVTTPLVFRQMDVVQKAYMTYWQNAKKNGSPLVQAPTLEDLVNANYLKNDFVTSLHRLYPDINYMSFNDIDDTVAVVEFKNMLGKWTVTRGGMVPPFKPSPDTPDN